MANIHFGVNLVPKANNTYTLGNSDYKWQIYINSINGTSTADALLPAVSSTDNGKILKVDNGAWSVESAPSELPSVSSADNDKILQVSSGVWTATALTIPTKVSDLTNDSGFLTSHQDISGKANSADLATVATSGSYSDLSNKPTIPTKVSDLTNDSGFVTTDTTYSTFVGSGSNAAEGLVPSPGSTAGTSKFLCEDGTWTVPPDTNTTYSTFIQSGSSAASGLVPAPSTTAGTTAFLCEDGTWKIPVDTTYSIMTGASSSTAGTSGLVPAPAAGDENKFLAGDGTYKSGGLPMVILRYGTSTWDDFINAYNNNVIVYCRASSNSNPASGNQTRMAFMAYVNAEPPTNVEFQYYRSVSSHSATQMGDQVFIYKLDKTNGWSVTTREASIKQITGSGITVAWSSNKVTLTNDVTVSDSLTDTSTTKALSAAKGKALNDIISDIGTVVASTNSGGIDVAANEDIFSVSVSSGGTYIAMVSMGYVLTAGALVLKCSESGQSSFMFNPGSGWAKGIIAGIFNPSGACSITLSSMEPFSCQNNHSPLTVVKIK